MINARIIVEPNFKTKFPRNVTKEVTTKVKRVAPRIKTRVTEEIRIAVREALVATPEYQSILQGKLRAQLGIPDPNTRIITIIDTWVNNISVKVKTGTSPLLLIDIGLIRTDYGDVLSLPQATYTYRSKHGQGEIPWLKWLLLEGDKESSLNMNFQAIREAAELGWVLWCESLEVHGRCLLSFRGLRSTTLQPVPLEISNRALTK